MLAAMGAEAFAERARRELLAAGETVRKLAVETRTELTAQEASIARLARYGQTNTEIGTQLFLSARTVEWHLGKRVHQARDQFAPRAAPGAGATRACGPASVASPLHALSGPRAEPRLRGGGGEGGGGGGGGGGEGGGRGGGEEGGGGGRGGGGGGGEGGRRGEGGGGGGGGGEGGGGGGGGGAGGGFPGLIRPRSASDLFPARWSGEQAASLFAKLHARWAADATTEWMRLNERGARQSHPRDQSSTLTARAAPVSPAAQPVNNPTPPPRCLSSSISSVIERRPVGPCGCPKMRLHP